MSKSESERASKKRKADSGAVVEAAASAAEVEAKSVSKKSKKAIVEGAGAEKDEADEQDRFEVDPGAISPIAFPLASAKLQKKVFKSVKKGPSGLLSSI